MVTPQQIDFKFLLEKIKDRILKTAKKVFGKIYVKK